MTLRSINPGETALVESISLRDDTSRRLEMLGLTKGTAITLLNKKRGGAIIVKVRGTRYAFGREIADGIEVSNG